MTWGFARSLWCFFVPWNDARLSRRQYLAILCSYVFRMVESAEWISQLEVLVGNKS